MLWGNQVVISPPRRAKIIDTLHEGHPGMVRMKSLTRCYVWWPRMEKELEQKVKDCALCQVMQNLSPRVPACPWNGSAAMGHTSY